MYIPVVSNLITAVGNGFKASQERKAAVETAKLKIHQANDDAKNQLNLTDAEWESISVSQQQQSWKDEYVTVLITSPLALILIGAIWQAFTGDAQLLVGVVAGIESLKALGVDMGYLMNAVVMAAIGLKLWRSRS